MVMDVIRYAANEFMKSVDQDDILEWIEREKIIEKLFGDDSHLQIIKRSSYVLRFWLRAGRMTEEQMKLFWDNSKTRNMELKRAIYRVTDNVSQTFSKPQLKFLAEEIQKIPPQQLQTEDIQLLMEIFKQFYEETAIYRKCGYLWTIMINESGAYQNSIVKFSKELFGKLLSSSVRKNIKT